MGIDHILIIILGVFTFVLGFYDLKTGRLSSWLREVFSWPGNEPKNGKAINLLPLFVSIGLIIYGVYRITEYGFVNTDQGEIMRSGNFLKFTLIFAGISMFLSAALAVLHIRK